MELIVKTVVITAGALALCVFTPLGDLVVFLLDKIGFHVGKKYGLNTTVGPAEPKSIVLVGTLGRPLADLLPSGIAEFDGKRIDVLAQEKSIGKGESIRVARVEGTKIYVEKETSEPPGCMMLSRSRAESRVRNAREVTFRAGQASCQ